MVPRDAKNHVHPVLEGVEQNPSLLLVMDRMTARRHLANEPHLRPSGHEMAVGQDFGLGHADVLFAGKPGSPTETTRAGLGPKPEPALVVI